MQRAILITSDKLHRVVEDERSGLFSVEFNHRPASLVGDWELYQKLQSRELATGLAIALSADLADGFTVNHQRAFGAFCD